MLVPPQSSSQNLRGERQQTNSLTRVTDPQERGALQSPCAGEALGGLRPPAKERVTRKEQRKDFQMKEKTAYEEALQDSTRMSCPRWAIR